LEAKGERAASRCPICRSELEDEAVEALGKWLAPLQGQNVDGFVPQIQHINLGIIGQCE
jgi:hypothetical protein